MNLQQIKDAVLAGKKVYWITPRYQVVHCDGDFCISHTGGTSIGLTWRDGVTLNGEEADFKVDESV